jgi:AraC-like DNA-binding protein
VLEAAGGSKVQLLAELDVTEDTLTAPEQRVALTDALAIVERAVELSSRGPLTMALSMTPSATSAGPVGFAAIACATVGESLAVSLRYAPLVSAAIRLLLRTEGERVALDAEPVFDMGAAGNVIIPAMLIALWRSGQTFTGQPLVGDVEFSFPEPDYFKAYASLAPGAVRFDQPRDRLLFERAYLDLPLVTANASAARAMCEECERLLQELSRESTLAARVQEALFAADGSLCSARRLARQLGMSERTLKRRLAEQQTSYTALLDAARRTRALALIGSELSVEEVSARLGYSDAANFTRAFRRWTGQSPRAARRESRAARS